MIKKVIIISATPFTNLELANDISEILTELNAEYEILNIEDYDLPLFKASDYETIKSSVANDIDVISKKIIDSHGIIMCAPEYNGSIPPILTNMIAWISVTSKHWRDVFNQKISLVASSSGGGGSNYHNSMKIQLEHLGSVVMHRGILVSSSTPLNVDSAKKILKQFIKLL